MPQVTDQMQRVVEVPTHPQRIISLVPSQTELLADLGLGDRVVGITKFCLHPKAWHQSKARIGGTKKVRMDKLHALNPDLIIGNKEENQREQIEALATQYPVWMSAPNTLPEVVEMIQQIGSLVQCHETAQILADRIVTSFEDATLQSHCYVGQKVAYFIWKAPYMVAGQDTLIDDLLQRCGLVNVFSCLKNPDLEKHIDPALGTKRYPAIDEALIREAAPELILLSSEPYPFKEQHLELLADLCPKATVKLVDGELFSWGGSRLQYAAEYFKSILV